MDKSVSLPMTRRPYVPIVTTHVYPCFRRAVDASYIALTGSALSTWPFDCERYICSADNQIASENTATADTSKPLSNLGSKWGSDDGSETDVVPPATALDHKTR